MQYIVIIPFMFVVIGYVAMAIFVGIAFALQLALASIFAFLALTVKLKYVSGLGYILFEVIKYYRPESKARVFSVACLLLFLLHFLLAAITMFDYVGWSEVTFLGLLTSFR